MCTPDQPSLHKGFWRTARHVYSAAQNVLNPRHLSHALAHIVVAITLILTSQKRYVHNAPIIVKKSSFNVSNMFSGFVSGSK